MAIQFDERAEAVGYDETGWTESVGSGNTVDEDAAPSEAGSPSGWGSRCIKTVTAGTNTLAFAVNSSIGALADSYTRMEMVLTAMTLVGSDHMVCRLYNAGFGKLAKAKIIGPAAGGDYRVTWEVYHDGSQNDITTSDLDFNTRYRHELKWLADTNVWELRLDGVALGSGTLTSTHVTNLSIVQLGSGEHNAADAVTAYYDLFTVDDADWVGAEISMVGPGMMMGVGT